MTASQELSTFLRAQRSRLRPEDVGLIPDAVPRRVPGLRREEVARLAGVSTDYYTRLEQGRKSGPSESVLNAVARALNLDSTARRHLFHLARPESLRAPGQVREVQRVRWETQRLIDSWADQPALVLGRRTDVLATNALGRALLFDFDSIPAAQRNYTRWMLLDPQARAVMRDWETVASEMVAVLRVEAGRFPEDRGISDLVGELTVRSAEFSGWWADQKVLAHTHGTKRFRHPIAGDLELSWQGLALPGDDDQTIFVYFADPDSPSAERLALLASWYAEERDARRPAALRRTLATPVPSPEDPPMPLR
ncbi:transcriptional regulator with XRE-family HTH domain [Mycetocola sp. BIGb0189]|uniref:helix-turn-helix domain-containing protein n=1 Tax=Mycetocola sp. BIGb0189 TaxID=2940604 RepID=UPI0021670C48|nr:helix-turn-helix transcriptional regulator [Mycetocola sp. BIGb0189]MCS4277451.1 transcriptional regulator with XRE-family HTH domain [Mycetocola sp. BIGb0189]